jgi:hypothetical protein
VRSAFGRLLIAATLISTAACSGRQTADSATTQDTALASRVDGLVDAILTSDDESRETAAFADARAIFEREGVLTIARVGDQAAYGFVFINLQKPSSDFRTAFLARVRDAARRSELPEDAVAYAEARRLQLEIDDRLATQAPANPGLRDQITALLKDDQAVREKGTFDLKRMAAADRKTAGPLKAIFDRYGVPTYDLVGVRAAKDFVVMVQHQPAEFRRVVLPKLKANVDAGQADPGSYATVYDRTQRDQGKNQLYGQNFECSTSKTLDAAPIDDASHVNARRAEMGLMRLEMYARLVRLFSPNACAAVGAKK